MIITVFVLAILVLIAALVVGIIITAVAGISALIHHWRACQAVIRDARFAAYADEAIALTTWSDEENEIFLGRRPFR